jgi:hypothetical protein
VLDLLFGLKNFVLVLDMSVNVLNLDLRRAKARMITHWEDVLGIPLGLAVVKENEDGEEDVDAKLDDL